MTLSGRGFTETAAPLLDFFIERYTEAFEAEITAFAQAVETGQPAVVGFEDGRLALVLAEAAIKSIAERRVVEVTEVA